MNARTHITKYLFVIYSKQKKTERDLESEGALIVIRCETVEDIKEVQVEERIDAFLLYVYSIMSYIASLLVQITLITLQI